jgi:hypothetical protein
MKELSDSEFEEINLGKRTSWIAHKYNVRKKQLQILLVNRTYYTKSRRNQVSITSKDDSILYSFLRSNTKSLVSFFAMYSARQHISV